MKTISIGITLFLLTCLTGCKGQTKQDENKLESSTPTVQIDSNKQLNLLDEQTKMFGQVFDLAGAREDNPLGGASNYMELIEKMDLPKEQKNMLRDQYKVYDLSLDPAKKDSLKLLVAKMLKNAMKKSQSHLDN